MIMQGGDAVANHSLGFMLHFNLDANMPQNIIRLGIFACLSESFHLVFISGKILLYNTELRNKSEHLLI